MQRLCTIKSYHPHYFLRDILNLLFFQDILHFDTLRKKKCYEKDIRIFSETFNSEFILVS